MRNLFLLLLVFFTVASCKKKSTAPSTPTGPAVLNGLKGIKYKARYDSASQHPPKKYYTWTFKGTNPIMAVPGVDSFYAGYQLMFLSGNNATRFEYHTSDPSNAMKGYPMTITYNAANLPDTMTVTTMPGFGSTKFAFEYSGTLLVKITEALPKKYVIDTTPNWDNPYRFYLFIYNGSDPAQMVTRECMGGTSYSSDTTRYTAGTTKNNLAGSLALYLLLQYMYSTNEGSQFPADLPLYLSSNAIEAIQIKGNSYTYKYLTDTKGRITHRLTPGFSSFDTTFYFY